jgi:hypothetical protein
VNGDCDNSQIETISFVFESGWPWLFYRSFSPKDMQVKFQDIFQLLAVIIPKGVSQKNLFNINPFL